MAWRGQPAPRAQEAEAVVETVGYLTDGERLGPRGGQLDRERQSVEPPTQLRDVARVVRGDGEAWRRRRRPVREQPRRGGGQHGFWIVYVRGKRKWRQLIHDLSRDAQRGTTGGEHPEM